MKFRQYISGHWINPGQPAFECEGTIEQITHNARLNSFRNDRRFHRWVFSPMPDSREWAGKLMTENIDGSYFRVVGYLSETPALPVWRPLSKAATMRDVQLSPEEKRAIEERFNQRLQKEKTPGR